MPLVDLKLPEGIFKDRTDLSAKGHYIAGNNMRFWEGNPQRIGGIASITSSGATGFPRKLLMYELPNGTNYKLLATTTGLFHANLWNFTSISPAGFSNNDVNSYWTFERFGDNILILQKQGKPHVYKSSTRSLTEMQAETGASEVPTRANTMLYSKVGGHILFGGCSEQDGTTNTESIGVYNPKLVRWSHPDTFDFSPATNQRGGFLEMPDGNIITGMIENTDGRILVSTDTAMYLMTPTFASSVYALTEVGARVGCISKDSIIQVEDTIYWMGADGFNVWRGTYEKLYCPLFQSMRKGFDPFGAHKEKVFTTHLPQFNEIRWHYVYDPSPIDNSLTPNRYVCYNYKTGVWSEGELDVSAWTGAVGVSRHPVGIKRDRSMGFYETFGDFGGYRNTTYPPASITTSPIEVGGGSDALLHVNEFIGDFNMDDATNSINVSITSKKYPNDANDNDSKTFTLTKTQNKKNIRVRGRLVKVKVDVPANVEGRFEIGTNRVNVIEDGRR